MILLHNLWTIENPNHIYLLNEISFIGERKEPKDQDYRGSENKETEKLWGKMLVVQLEDLCGIHCEE